MGTDIHAVFQKKTDKGWEDVPSQFAQNRHYYLFGILAGVRNGYGYAGVKTYEPVQPISEPRGLPDDFLIVDDQHPCAFEVLSPFMREWAEKHPAEPVAQWMGDHSHSWLTSTEILEYAEKQRKSFQHFNGIIPIEDYRKWDGGPPESYCGGIWGHGIVLAQTEADVTPQTTHVRVQWSTNALEPVQYFIDEVKRIHLEHGEVRMVFGFDS